MAKTQQKSRKKRVAAHIRAAQEKRKYKAAEAGDDVHVPKLGAKRPRTEAVKAAASADDGASEAKHTAQARALREMSEAKQYLRAWKQKEDGQNSGWKFNKKVQVWLIRHMYDSARVDKKDFKLLAAYLDGMQGAARQRLAAEARDAIEKCAPLLDDDAGGQGEHGGGKGGFQFGFEEEQAEGGGAGPDVVDKKTARLMHARALLVAEALA